MPEQGEQGERREHTTFHDLLDNLVVTSDDVPLGRVADVQGEWRDDGRLVLTALLLGPEAAAGRVSHHLRLAVGALLRGRFDHALPFSEVAEIGMTIRLRGRRADYEVGRRSEDWIATHVLRFLSWFRY